MTACAGFGKWKSFERALAISPDNVVANNNLALVLVETGGDLNRALTAAQRAKAAAPSNPNITDTLAVVYVKRGMHQNAVQVLAPIVAAQPARVDFRTHYAEALFRDGKLEQARKELKSALKNKPTSEQESEISKLLAKIGS